MTISTDLGEKTLAEIDGLHEDNQTTLKDIKDTLDSILELVTGMSAEGGKDVTSSVGEKLKATLGNKDGGDGKKDKSGKEDGGKAKIGDKVQVSDLSNIGANYAQGALLINSTLIRLSNELKERLTNQFEFLAKTIEKAMGGDGKSSSKSKDSGSSGGKSAIGKISPGEVKGLAESLKEFAKACVILAVIPNKLVDTALGTFKNFIFIMTDAANHLTKNAAPHFKTFTQSIIMILNGLKTYAAVVALLALTLPLAPLALINVGILGLMIQIIGAIGAQAKVLGPFILSLSRALIQIGISMILFGVALMLTIQVGKQAIEALKGTLLIIAVLGAFILIGWLCTVVGIAIAGMAVTFIGLGVAMILFNVALILMNNIKVDEKQINNVLNAIETISTSFAKNALIITGALISVLLFTAFTALFMVSMLLLTLGLALLLANQAILKNLKKVTYKDGEGKEVEGEGLEVIENILAIAKQFEAKAGIIILSALAMIPFLIFAALFTVSIALVTVGVLLLFVSDMLLHDMMIPVKDEDGAQYGARPIFDIIAISKQFCSGAGWFALAMLAMVPALVFIAEFTVFSVLAAVAAVSLVVVDKSLNKIGSVKDINNLGHKLMEAGIGVMLGFLGVNREPGGKIDAGVLTSAAWNAAKMMPIGLSAVAAIVPMAVFMTSAALIGKSFVSLNESLKGIDASTIEAVFSGLGGIMENLSEFAKNMKGTSAKTIAAIGGLVKDVAEAIGMLTDIVIKLKDGIPDEQIQAATTAMLHICEGLFGRPGEQTEDGHYTLCSTLESIASADLQDLNAEAVGAIAPLMDGIDKMSQVVIKLSNKDVFSEEAINAGIENLGRFLTGMMCVTEAMQYLITKRDSGEREKAGGLWGFLGGQKKVMKSPLDAMNEVMESGFFDTLNQVFGKIQGSINVIQQLSPDAITPVVDFMASGAIEVMSQNSVPFVKGMESFAKGIDMLKEKNVTNFRNFLDAFAKANASQINTVTKSLVDLGNAASKFQKVADSFERMEKSITKMAKAENKITSVFDKIKSGVSKKDADKLDTDVTEAIGGTGMNPYVEKIYDVLTDWNENGIPIRAQIDNSTGEIKPLDVNNTTGTGGSR